MSDLWADEGGFGDGGPADEIAGDDWDEGEESLEASLEDALADPEELEGEGEGGDEDDDEDGV
jgi:hypothetical protein